MVTYSGDIGIQYTYCIVYMPIYIIYIREHLDIFILKSINKYIFLYNRYITFIYVNIY